MSCPLGHDHCSESNVISPAGSTPKQVVPELARKDVQRGVLALAVGWDGSPDILISLQLEVVFRDADRYGLEILDGLKVETFHLIPQALEADLLAMVDVPEETSPHVDSL